MANLKFVKVTANKSQISVQTIDGKKVGNIIQTSVGVGSPTPFGYRFSNGAVYSPTFASLERCKQWVKENMTNA